MFGDHQLHPVSPLNEGVKGLRKLLNDQIEAGNLKVVHSEKVLLDVREAELNVEKAKKDLIKSVNDKFNSLIRVIKERREVVIHEIEDFFDYEKKAVKEKEMDWQDRQGITEQLLKLGSSESKDGDLLQNSKYILEGVARVNTPPKFNEIKIATSVDDHLRIQEEGKPLIDITLPMMLAHFKDYINMTEHKAIQYKA